MKLSGRKAALVLHLTPFDYIAPPLPKTLLRTTFDQQKKEPTPPEQWLGKIVMESESCQDKPD